MWLCETIGIPPRALRRQLAERQLSFRLLVDDLRREPARQYIAELSLSLVEVAFLLGFSEQSAFQLPFRRWTGEAPDRARRAHLAT
jgi:AraC-like DNA-binding protein